VEGAREQPAAGAPAPRDRVQDLHRPARPRQLRSPQALRQQRRAEGAVRGGRLDRGARRHHLPQGTYFPFPLLSLFACLSRLPSPDHGRAPCRLGGRIHVHDSSALDLLHCFALHAALRCVASTGRQLQRTYVVTIQSLFSVISSCSANFQCLSGFLPRLEELHPLVSCVRGCVTWQSRASRRPQTHSPQDPTASDESYRVPTPVTDPSSVASSPAYFSQYIHRKTK
jgi:hypothetical protein